MPEMAELGVEPRAEVQGQSQRHKWIRDGGGKAIDRSLYRKIPNLIISHQRGGGHSKDATLVPQGIFSFHNPSADLIPAIDCILQIKLFDKPILSDPVRG